MSERLVDLKNERVDLGIRIADLKSVEDIKRSKLVTVLDEFSVPGNNIYAVYTERRHLPAKVRLFIDFPEENFWRDALLGMKSALARQVFRV